MSAASTSWPIVQKLGANSDAIKAVCALIAAPGALWGCFLWIKKLRGVGIDDRVGGVSSKTDRLLRENLLLRPETVQVRKLIEHVSCQS